MRDKNQRHINRQIYLQALGLFTIARQHQRKCVEAEKALAVLLGVKDASGYCGHLSDEIYGDGDFNGALKRENIVLSGDTKSRKPKK